MNGRVSKKLRRMFRKEFKVYYNQMCDLKFWDRFWFCWDIMRRYRWK